MFSAKNEEVQCDQGRSSKNLIVYGNRCRVKILAFKDGVLNAFVTDSKCLNVGKKFGFMVLIMAFFVYQNKG